MSKCYIKENGKWKLTDKQETQIQVVINEQKQLTLENVNERLLKIEDLLEAMMK